MRLRAQDDSVREWCVARDKCTKGEGKDTRKVVHLFCEVVKAQGASARSAGDDFGCPPLYVVGSCWMLRAVYSMTQR
jgi:hypothetical protein